jgi:hypothetical protein
VVREVRGERPDAAEAVQRIAKFAADCADELGSGDRGRVVGPGQVTVTWGFPVTVVLVEQVLPRSTSSPIVRE